MTSYVNLSDLTRVELENLLLTVHSAHLRTLVAVRENTEESWKVRREVEAIAAEEASTRAFTKVLVRTRSARVQRRRAERNARAWSVLG